VSALHGPVLYHGRRKHTPPDEPEGYGVLDTAGYTFYERDGSVWTAAVIDDSLTAWWQSLPFADESQVAHEAAAAWIAEAL
jgi:hypothetical protein